MRAVQYAFVLVVQVALLCAMFAVGARVIDLPSHWGGVTSTSEGPQPPAGQGLDRLGQHLSH